MEGSIAHLRQDLNIIPLPTAGDQQQPAPSKTESSPPVYDPKTWKLAKYETVDAERGYYDDGAYERGPDGKFKDEDLARILKDATREPAGAPIIQCHWGHAADPCHVNGVTGAFGARNVPSVFRGIDAMTMAAGRDTWKICTLNEFRFVTRSPDVGLPTDPSAGSFQALPRLEDFLEVRRVERRQDP